MDKTIILVGNPNVGKSVIFGRLTGKYAVVSNYPGTTVDISRGVLLHGDTSLQVIDTPGTYSLFSSSEDEQVTRDVLFRERPDVIVQVADAKNLQRNLLLTLELMELKVPVVLALNMTDEARQRGIRVDRRRLEALLGIPVVETVGITGEGVHELRKTIFSPLKAGRPHRYADSLEHFLAELEPLLPVLPHARRRLALLLLSGDKSAWNILADHAKTAVHSALDCAALQPGRHLQGMIFNEQNAAAAKLVEAAQQVIPVSKVSWLARLGELSMKPFPGYLIVFGVLFVMYEFVGVFAAGMLVDLLEDKVFGAFVIPWCRHVVGTTVPWPLLQDFLVGTYGVLTMALTYALAIVFPIVTAFFLYFGLLEDSGYLPRLSVMLDRMFRSFGLNGKAVLPMVLGLGCGTMAVLSSRILETRKERLLVVLLLSLTIPCSAQLGVILGLLGGLSWQASVLWFLSIAGSLFLVGFVADAVVPGARSPFIMEIPPLRRPSLGNIALKVKMRLVWYLKEAVPLFILATAILFTADKLHFITAIENTVRPVVVHFLGLPVEVTQSFIMGFLRRDYGAAGLFVLAKDGLLDPRQIVVSIVTITLFVPCIAQCFMAIREHGMKMAFAIFLFVSVYAVLFGGALNIIIKATGIL